MIHQGFSLKSRFNTSVAAGFSLRSHRRLKPAATVLKLLINCALAVLVALLTGCSQHGPTETLWLGHVAPMTGAERAAGDHAQKGIRIAVEGLNAKADDLVLGRKVAVRHANAKSDGHDAEAEAVRLVSVNRVVALLGGTDTAMAAQLARGAESAGVPVVLQNALPSPNENAFSCVPSFSRRGQLLARYARQDGLKAKSIGIVADERSLAGTALADAFTRELRDGFIRMSYKSADDLPPTLNSLTPIKPQVVMFAGSARDLPRFRTELQRTLPGAACLFGGEESSLPALLADRAAEDLYLATCYFASDETPANQAFIKKYQEEFHEPPDVNAALAYDGTRLLCAALRQANATNSAKLREVLPQLKDFESVTGPLTFGADRHARRPLFVVQIKNGQPVRQKRYGPDD